MIRNEDSKYRRVNILILWRWQYHASNLVTFTSWGWGCPHRIPVRYPVNLLGFKCWTSQI